MAPVYGYRTQNSDSGSESGSESEANESSASASSSDKSVKSKRNNSNPGSERSRSPSPANSRDSIRSNRRSRRDSGSTNSPGRRSESPEQDGGNQSQSIEAKSLHSNASGSRSPTPASPKSGTASPERDAESHRSESPADKDNTSAKSDHSRSPSIGSQSVKDNMKKRSRSHSGSRGSSGRSRSQSIDSGKSPMSNHSDHKNNDAPSSGENSRPGSRNSQRSRSSSKNRSDSEANSVKGSPRKIRTPETKSRSNSPNKSRSASPHSDSEHNNLAKSESPSHKDAEVDEGGISNDKKKESDHFDESEVKDSAKKRKRAMVSDESGSEEDQSAKKKFVVDDKDEEEEEEEEEEGGGGGGEEEDDDEDNDDDDEEGVEKDLVIDAEALFGNASDISSEEEGGKKDENLFKVTEEKVYVEDEHEEEDDEMKDQDQLNDMERCEDKENEPEDQPAETRIDVEVPKITMNLGKELHFIKLPNFLSVETRPFDKANYEDEIDEEETLDEEGRARLKLKVENTIRWREVTGKDGKLVKQSNARFVRWSDGSMSLHLGSEIFDVYKQSLHGDHNHLFIRQGTGLQGQAVFRTKLTFRPHSTESFTHRKMTMSLADRSQKTTGIKVLSLVGKDPEAHRGELIKKEEERLKASVRRASKQKRVREKAVNRGISLNYLEPDRYNDADSDDEVISINAIKIQHQNKMAHRKGDRPHIYSSDEEGSDIETRRARRLDKAKALKDSDSEEDSGGGDQSRGRSSSRED